MKLKTVLSFLFFGLCLSACSEKKENLTSEEATFTVAEAAGNISSTCLNIQESSALNSTSYLRLYQLNADATYLMTIKFYSQSHCVPGGGDNFMTFSQSGKWSVEAGSSVPGGSNIKFVVDGDANLTVYGATTLGHDVAGYLNAACSTTFNHSATKSLNVSGLHCVRSSAPTLDWEFPNNTETVGNAGILTKGTPATLQMAAPSVLWWPGEASSYPTSVNLTLSYY